MDRKVSDKKITAIVPAYNEAARIGPVLDVLVSYPHFLEIIVIDDGSTDNTQSVVAPYDVRYVKSEQNRGKGHAMDLGVAKAESDIVFFVDADISGLTHEMIDRIVTPVIRGDVEMFIGMRNRKIYYVRHILLFVPLLGGERALTKKLWKTLPPYFKHRFRIEAGLNFYAEYYGKGLAYTFLQGLSQVVKEKKYGFFDGLSQRFGMMWNIVSAQYRLYTKDMPHALRKQKIQTITNGVKRKLKNLEM